MYSDVQFHEINTTYLDHDGFDPALLENTADHGLLTNWLANRILEIESLVGHTPSIAVFVNTEDKVSPIAKALAPKLAENSTKVMACHDGQVVGNDSSVRIFDIQHIKGLEFEAAFFIGVDQLADVHPELFGKYLYVGATRAATYLGITCVGKLPEAIEELREHFTTGWQV